MAARAEPARALAQFIACPSLLFVSDDAIEQSSVVASRPGACVSVVVDQDTRRIGGAAWNADVVECDDRRIARPLHLDRDRGRNVLGPILDARLDDPGFPT